MMSVLYAMKKSHSEPGIESECLCVVGRGQEWGSREPFLTWITWVSEWEQTWKEERST